MITVNFTPTFKNVQAFFNKYNEQFLESIPSNYSKIEDPDLSEERYRNDTANMLRQSHRDLMERIIKNFAKQLNEAQRVQGEFQYLPAHRTNNSVLATQLGVSTRTISNLMHRLGPDGAGFILHKRFRGSTHDYELKLNVQLLSIAKKGIPAIPVSHDDEILDEREYYAQNANSLSTANVIPSGTENVRQRPAASGSVRQTSAVNSLETSKLQNNTYRPSGTTDVSPSGKNDSGNLTHINDVNSIQKNEVINTNAENQNNDFTDFTKNREKKFPNKDNDDILNNHNNRSGEIVKKMTISDLFSKFNGDTQSQKSIGSQEISSVTPSLGDQKGMENPRVAPAPQTDESLSNLKQKNITFLHNLMYGTIFSRQKYHAPSQVEYAKQYLINEFEKLDYRQTNEKFRELKIRIWLAFECLKRNLKNPTPGWIPIPSTYLDPLNFKSGFVNTLIWHDKFVENRRNQKKIAEYNIAIADYFQRWDLLNRALGFYLKDQNYFSYQKATNYLRKKDPEIVAAFNTMVSQNHLKFDEFDLEFLQQNQKHSA